MFHETAKENGVADAPKEHPNGLSDRVNNTIAIVSVIVGWAMMFAVVTSDQPQTPVCAGIRSSMTCAPQKNAPAPVP